MPKRVGHLYEKMCDKDLIREAIKNGSKHKRKRHDVQRVLRDMDKFVDKVYSLVITGSYVPTVPKVRHIHDKSSGKERDITVVPFYPDGIMHQLVVMAMEPVIMRGMYRWSCASIPGRGNACARKYVRRALDNDPRGTKYCAKMDIRHYYPNIDIDRLMAALRRKIKDERFLQLVEAIVRSNPLPGLAIGFYVDQWLANYYLEPMDGMIAGLPGVKYYVRNMDDMVLLGPNKKKLHKAVRAIDKGLRSALGVYLKDDWQVFPVDARAVNFVGYRFYHSHTRLRGKAFLRFTRQCRKVGKIMAAGLLPSYHAACGILSRAGSLKHCDCVQARRRYFGPLDRHKIKNVVRGRAKNEPFAGDRPPGGHAAAGAGNHQPAGGAAGAARHRDGRRAAGKIGGTIQARREGMVLA